MISPDSREGQPSGRVDFATTHWSMVFAAGNRASPQLQLALAALCDAYWYPLYAYARRQGRSPEQAQDLTQEFFVQLLEKDSLRSADPERGKFRSFLLACFRHFLANEADRQAAQKRGGGKTIVSVDGGRAEDRYRLEPSHNLTAERLFERRWALTVLQQVLQRLRDELSSAGRSGLFERLKSYLTGESGGGSYQEAAAELGMTEGAVKVAVHRLRQRYRELLREEIGRTLDSPAEVDEEIRSLFAALG